MSLRALMNNLSHKHCIYSIIKYSKPMQGRKKANSANLPVTSPATLKAQRESQQQVTRMGCQEISAGLKIATLKAQHYKVSRLLS